jgi:glutathione S-transferase
MKLYGTSGSPFARRVRVFAAEVGQPVEFVSTLDDAGRAQLREVSPIKKVPVAVVGDRTIFDSRAIIEWLIQARGWGTIVPPRDVWHDSNLINALDEALLSVVQVFYLLNRDKVPAENLGVVEKRQYDRADAIFAWAKPQLREHEFGLPELSAICTLDWMDYRSTYKTERAGLQSLRAAWKDRPTLVDTAPRM